MTIIVGLDLSLTCTGVVAAPVTWGGDFTKAQALTFEAEPLPKLKKGEARSLSENAQMVRISHLAHNITEWCVTLERERMTETVVYIEERTMHVRHGSTRIAELHAIVKHRLAKAGLTIHMVTASSARAFLLGRGNVPRKGEDAKNSVQATLRNAGCPVEWNQDQTDAMCVLNYGMAQHDASFFSSPARAA